ncbi:MAG: EFR1 family ferrodoxin [Candidatus Methanogranum gryphiswaldense]|nr:MAG: EFR1 family ferrodoxin [Candidatus Methanogranum sp. U3.2.1]
MIICFSGTGNSMHVAKYASAVIGDEVVSINDLLRLREKEPLRSERPWVLVCPIYAWRIPRVVEKFILENAFMGNKQFYSILTCDSEVGSADRYLKKLCTEKGFVYMGMASVNMPENLITMYHAPSDKDCEVIVRRADRRVKGLAELINSEVKLTDNKSKSIFKSAVVNPIFYKFYVKPEGFRTTDLCTSCGLCTSNCPMNNIKMIKGRPQWENNCTFCMSCICRCPTEAIEYKNKTKGKRRYVCVETDERS